MKLQDNKREKPIQKEVTKERIGSSFPKPLNPEEESYYLALYENGNEEEKKLAKDILIKGIASYNSKGGVRLAAYIARCIKNTIRYKR